MSPLQVGTGSLPFIYQDFSGGLNTLQNPYLLTDNEARDLLNVQGTSAGSITKRNGLVTFATPATSLTSLFALEAMARYLIGADASSLYSISPTGAISTIKSGLSNNRWEWVSATPVGAQGPAYGVNGVDPPQTWNGSTGTTGLWTATDSGGSVPNGKYCVWNQNQVFIAGTAVNRSRVYWSGVADPTAWNPTNLNGSGFMDFDPFDGAPITGIGVAGPYLLVGKPRKLWVLISPATAQARMLSNTIGIAAHRSLAQGAEGTYFLAEDYGVYVTNGSTLTPISDKIRPVLDTVALRSQASAGYFNRHYYLSVSLGGSANDVTFDFDALLKTWWKHSLHTNQFAIWHPAGASTPAQLYSARSTDAVVNQCFVPNVYTDNGQPMPWVWRGPWQSPSFYRRRRFPTPYFTKRLRQVRAQGQGTVDFSLARDFEPLESLIQPDIFHHAGGLFGAADGSVFGAADGSMFGAADVVNARIFGQGVANAFSVVFGATSTTQDQLYLYMLSLTDRRNMIPA